MKAITPDLIWLPECHATDARHKHISAYLISSGKRNILIDSSSHIQEEEFVSKLNNCVGKTGLDALILTHSDLPHAGNVQRLRREFGGFSLYAAFTGGTAPPEVLGMGDSTAIDMGRTMEICGRELSFPWPPLADVTNTAWIFDHGSSTLFTADGFGHFHSSGSCELTTAELEKGVRSTDILDFHRYTLPWLPYIDPNRIRDALKSLITTYDPSCIAPVHGNPIMAADIPTYMSQLQDALVAISNTTPTIRA